MMIDNYRHLISPRRMDTCFSSISLSSILFHRQERGEGRRHVDTALYDMYDMCMMYDARAPKTTANGRVSIE